MPLRPSWQDHWSWSGQLPGIFVRMAGAGVGWGGPGVCRSRAVLMGSLPRAQAGGFPELPVLGSPWRDGWSWRRQLEEAIGTAFG